MRGVVDAEAQGLRHSEATPVAVESPAEARSSTLSFPRQNQQGDSSPA